MHRTASGWPFALAALAAVGLIASSPSSAQLPAPGAVIATRDTANARMMVGVTIAEKGPFHFIIDTGAERTVISQELAATLALPSAGPAELHSVSEVSTVPTVMIPSLSLNGRVVENIRAPALAQANLGAAGILGIDTLQGQQVILDFRKQEMVVRPAAKRPDPPATDDEIVVRARSRLGRLILADANVDGRRISVIVDTGAEVTLGNSALFARFSRSAPWSGLIEVVGVTGGRVLAQGMLLRRVQINQIKFSDMPVAVADAHIFRQLGLDKKPALLLGMDVLRGFNRVSVDFANREVRFLVPGEASREEARFALGL